MHRFSESCNVADGAKIYLSNTSDWDTIRLEGTVTRQDAADWPNMKWDEAAFRYDDEELRTYYDLFH